MISYNNANTRRKLIMEHYSKPNNKTSLKEKQTIDIFSNECVDELHLDFVFQEDKLVSAKWDGVGCAVFQASTDIFLDLIKNKTKKEIEEINNTFEKLINGEKVDQTLLKELNIFDNVGKQLNRLHCAYMIIRGIKKAI